MARDIKVGSYVKVISSPLDEELDMKGVVEKIQQESYGIGYYVRFDDIEGIYPFERKEIAPANRKRNA